MTNPKLIGVALLLLAAAPFACAVRYKNDPGPPPRDPSPVPPFGASTWHELPALFSGDPANAAAGSAHRPLPAKGTAAASAVMPPSALLPPPSVPPPSAAPPPAGSTTIP
jgi:hypothetical protein